MAITEELKEILKRCHLLRKQKGSVSDGLSIHEEQPLRVEDIVGPYFRRYKEIYDYSQRCTEPDRFERHMAVKIIAGKEFSAADRVNQGEVYTALLANGYTPFEIFDGRMELIDARR